MKKLLVIEDDRNIRISLVELLEIRNYEVISAKEGKEGVELAIKEKPDLIICDIMMPRMNGYEVLRNIRHHHKFRMPFLFLSALSSKEDIKEGMSHGATDYITKPFKAKDLFEKLQRILAQE